MSMDIAAAVQALGREFNPSVLAATREIYAPSVRLQPRDASAVRNDVPYGTHPRQVLDIYGDGLDGPIVLFVHGGGFVAGDKRGDALFYANIGHALARRGIQAVLANYRLAPQATWPAGSEDVDGAVRWIAQHLAGHRPLVVIGQSAGATHVAGYLYGEATAADAAQRLAGCVLMSGVYDQRRFRSPGATAYFGADEAAAAQRSPITLVRPTGVPLLVTVSELDPAAIAPHSFALAQRVTEVDGAAPAFHWFRGHNHVSPVHSLGSPQTDAEDVLVDFVQRCAAR